MCPAEVRSEEQLLTARSIGKAASSKCRRDQSAQNREKSCRMFKFWIHGRTLSTITCVDTTRPRMSPPPRPRDRDPGYKPKWNDPCPCGWGRTFQTCCRPRLPGSDKITKAWRQAAKAGDWEEALVLVRADVAQYVIWHRRHTIPGLRHPDLPVDIFGVDVEALSAHVGSLIQVLYRLDRLNQAPAILAKLRPAIADERWHRKIVYHRAFTTLLTGDRAKARLELVEAGPITADEEDVDLLQIHIDLNGSRLGFTERQALYKRVGEITRSRADRLQYGGAAAFDVLLLGDEKGGRDAVVATVALGRELEAEKSLSSTAEYWLCRSLETLAVLDQDKATFDELIGRLTSLLARGEWTETGRADLLRNRGDAYRQAGDFKLAMDDYRASLRLVELGIVQVFLAECLYRDGFVAEALELIRTVPVDRLSAAEVADHAFVYYYIARASKDGVAWREADQRLRAAVTPHPYFQGVRLQYLIDVQDALTALAASKEPVKLGPVMGGLAMVSRYLILQPNFGGLGVNINNMIDDAVELAEKKARGELP